MTPTPPFLPPFHFIILCFSFFFFKVLVQVAIFHSQQHRREQETLVLGSQTLADLRDAILCDNDLLGQARAMAHSSFFFIEVLSL